MVGRTSLMRMEGQSAWWKLTLCALTIFMVCIYLLERQSHTIAVEIPQNTDSQIVNNVAFIPYSFPSVPNPQKDSPVSSDTLTQRRDEASQAPPTQTESNITEPDGAVSNTIVDENDLVSIDMKIRMPLSNKHIKALGRFLYQCVNIGFGYVDREQTATDIYVVHPTQSERSAIFRRTQNLLFSNEKHWQQRYGETKNYMRFYPAWIDKRLLSYINQNLHGQALESLTATYSLQNNLLQLVDISINGQALAQVWTLANGYELGCR